MEWLRREWSRWCQIRLDHHTPPERRTGGTETFRPGKPGSWRKPSEGVPIIVEKLKKRSNQSYTSTYALPGIYLGLGEKRHALGWLEKSYKAREDAMIWLNSDPVLDDVRAEPRFQELVRRFGLPQ